MQEGGGVENPKGYDVAREVLHYFKLVYTYVTL